MEQILSGNSDEMYSVSPSPGATALAALALLAVGPFETSLALAGLWRYEKVVPREVLDKGIRNLLIKQNSNGSFMPSYRGVYAKGWNYEEPLTTALTAIRALQRYQRLYKASFFR